MTATDHFEKKKYKIEFKSILMFKLIGFLVQSLLYWEKLWESIIVESIYAAIEAVESQ